MVSHSCCRCLRGGVPANPPPPVCYRLLRIWVDCRHSAAGVLEEKQNGGEKREKRTVISSLLLVSRFCRPACHLAHHQVVNGFYGDTARTKTARKQKRPFSSGMPEHPLSKPSVSENAKRVYNGEGSTCPTNEASGRSFTTGRIKAIISSTETLQELTPCLTMNY